MAEQSAKKKKSQPKRKSSSKAKKTTASNKSSSSGKKSAARLEWEYQRKRFIIAVVQFILSVLLLLIFFMHGENVWYALHILYRGTFGVSAIALSIILLYCAYQNVQDKPTEHFKLKVFLFSLLTFLFSMIIYCFTADAADYVNYFNSLNDSLAYSAHHHFSAGAVSAILGIPLVNLFGSVGAGLISSAAFLAALFATLDSMVVNFIDTIRRPAQKVSEHISDNQKIRQEVRRRKQEQETQERQKLREEYVQKQVEKKMKKKNPDNEFTKVKNTPFYSPDNVNNKPENPKTKKKKTDEEPDVEIPPVQDENKQPAFVPDDDIIYYPENNAEPVEESVPVQDVYQPKPKPEPQKTPEPKQTKTQPEKDFDITNNSFIEGEYIKPPFTLLEPQPPENQENISMELNQVGQSLVETLKSFGVQTSIVNICKGPSVTRFELQPATGVKISKITHLADDIAMNLAAMGVRIEAPIPGKAAVGIEVPNKTVSTVKMRDLVESKEFQNAKSNLTVILGKDITGKITLADLSKMPHLLIAGSTGSGKSVCINSMLVSLLYKSNPDDVKLLLIDPKVVELGVYNGIPHLLVPVVTDPRKAAGALNWAVNEMLNRYKTFAEFNVRDIHGYNRYVEKQNAQSEIYYNDDITNDNDRTFEEDEMLAQAQSELNDDQENIEKEPVKLKKMPQVVIVIDELADLMMAASKEVEESICRLAQMARAAGMHLVIATQRPSVDVITGLIKANVPSRIAFAVKTFTDSKTILDMGGADKLLGKGDMLYSPLGVTKPVRIQGCFVNDTEVENIIEFIKKSKVVEYDSSVIDQIENCAVAENSGSGSDDGDGNLDPMMEEAIKCVVEAGQASTSMLQRRFRVGYARAGRLIDEMEQMGIVGPHEGAKPRKVLMTYQQWLERSVSGNSES